MFVQYQLQYSYESLLIALNRYIYLISGFSALTVLILNKKLAYMGVMINKYLKLNCNVNPPPSDLIVSVCLMGNVVVDYETGQP